MSPNLKYLKENANIIRKHIIEMLVEAGSGHPGGSLSAVDIVTALYFYKMKHNPKNPSWPDRDRFILSKGHAAPVLYAALAESGYFPLEELKTLRKINSRLQGHPSMKTPGVEVSTGSLGQGLSIGVGMALAGKLDKRNYRVYVLLGDGEVQEGQVWEAAMFASHHKLDNLTAILDRNGLQQTGPTETILSIEPIAAKWKSFGWEVFEIDGFDMKEIVESLDKIERIRNRPTIIIAHTTKGKGISFMEWVTDYHAKIPDGENLSRALKELSQREY